MSQIDPRLRPESPQKSKLHFGLEMESRALAWLFENVPRDIERRLLVRNERWKGGELDLILEETLAKGRVELVFVEVRARQAGAWTSGLESITWAKRRRLARSIERFLARYRGKALSARCDVMDWDGNQWRHYRDLRLD